MLKKLSSTSYSGVLKVKISSLYICIYMSITNLELNSLIQKLDKLQEGDLKKGGFKQKPRTLSTPSLSFPPVNAPKWAVKHRNEEEIDHETPSMPERSETHSSLSCVDSHVPESHKRSHNVADDFIDHLSSFSDDLSSFSDDSD